MSFYHGIKTVQQPTSLVPTRRVSAAISVVVGCAPIHRLNHPGTAAKVGTVALCYNYPEAVAALGCTTEDDFARWGLSEAAYAGFIQYGIAPMLFINLFDPSVHKAAILDESVAVNAGVARLNQSEVIAVESVAAESVEDAKEGIDYTIDVMRGQILLANNGKLAKALTLTVSYSYAKPELVTASDAIGGMDSQTGAVTGLQLLDQVFSQYRLVPGLILAPGFSDDPSIAAIMAMKASTLNGVFRAVALADLPIDELTDYRQVPEYKNKNNLQQEDLYLCWPRVVFNGKVMRMATQVAGLIAKTDADNDDVPYVSPSNKLLQMQGLTAGNGDIWLTLDQANYLNANGIATALNFVGGWKLWGNRTACFPDVTDIKDNFLTNRRLFGWYGNNLTLTWWQKVDGAMTRRLVQTIVNSEQITLNTMTANGYILGGRIEFNADENSITDLMDGLSVFHVYLGTASPAEQIHFKLEYDPDYLSTLFN
ncbi:phage tail sheath family protein [Providencia huashanensis]|uniref:phage tail sheath family protein n=1 Tax=Providencia huashanensis TaxID=3037798 RepID=UPI002AFEBB7C|nr:phage tail sheath family protein [Providencia sp. 23021821]